MTHRIEKDFLGEVSVSQEAYYGIFTQRAKQNFPISGIHTDRSFIHALGLVKLACAQANKECSKIEARTADALVKAARELADGKYDGEFILDVYQAGAGTPFNMNANEIIANRANELLEKGKRGDYKPVHPNDTANASQSSNDVIPTTIRVAGVIQVQDLIHQTRELSKAFAAKSREYAKLIKVGRTHLQDAVPITLGQEFASYAHALEKDLEFMQQAFHTLTELGIGGTAIGTGVNAPQGFSEKVVKHLNKETGIGFRTTRDKIDLTRNANDFAHASAALRNLAITLVRISNDLKLMASGPRAGFNEITLPEVEPGSSIMPGKVNPSVPECVEMIGLQVIGLDSVITSCASRGQLGLNTTTPLIAFNLLHSLKILTNGERILCECVQGMQANEVELKQSFENSLCTATPLTLHLGYQKTSELVKQALKQGKTIRQMVLEKKLLDEKTLDKMLEQNT